MGNNNPILTLNGGEVSPLVWGRSDLDKYRSFCKQLDNFIVEPQGAIKRRLGTAIQSRIGDVGTFEDSIIHPWLIDRSNHFQMVFVDGNIKFFSSQGILSFTLAIPYGTADFDQLYFRQIYDIMYVCHPDYPVKIITRTDQFVWTIADAQILGGPYAEDNFDTSSTVTVATGLSPSVTITALDPIFVETDVGRLFRVVHQGPNSDSGSYTSSQASTGLPASGQTVTLRSGGTWSGTASLELSTDDETTWTTIGSISSKSNFNGEIIRDIDDYGAKVRVNYLDTSGTFDWTLDVEGVLYNNYQITSFTSTTVVVADVVDGFFETVTANWEWALGAFSATTGYPTCCEIFDERLFLGGVISYPADIYVSQTNHWENFKSGLLSTSPFKFTLNADIRNRTRWFIADQQLVCGTDNAEFTIGSRTLNEAINIENITVANQKQYGSDPIQPIRADSTSYFVESGGRRVRSLNYLFERDSYMSDDISILADHLTKNAKISKIAFSRTPDKIVWCVLDDGTLISFTTEREQNVGAWARHPFLDEFGGTVIGNVLDIDSVLTIEGDVLGLIVEREDGVYYETISQGNDCFDGQTIFNGISPNDVLALPGDENFTYWDDSFVESEVPFQGTGSFLRLDITVNDLVIKYNGVQLELGIDYTQIRTNAFWLFNSPDESLITVDDLVTPVNPANYYTVNAADTFVIEVKATSEFGIIDFKIVSDVTTLTEDVEYFAMIGDSSEVAARITANESEVTGVQFLVIEPLTSDPDLITVEVIYGTIAPLLNDSSDPVTSPPNDEVFVVSGSVFEALPVDQYSVYTPLILISVYGESTTVANFGIKMHSTAITVDIYNSPDMGGGGASKRRNTEMAIFVVDSVNLECTANAGKPAPIWQKGLFIGQEAQMDVKIPLQTGFIKVRTQNGYDNQANIGIRSNSPYCLTVANINPYGTKTSQRSND